eukprot:Nk52_evm2s385 gene=Nk52_evmTU2s385
MEGGNEHGKVGSSSTASPAGSVKRKESSKKEDAETGDQPSPVVKEVPAAPKSNGDLWAIISEQASVTREGEEAGGGEEEEEGYLQKESEDSSVLFMGNKGGGKSTAILKFLRREDRPEATTALEYIYVRKTGKGGHNALKDVGHIWELGGGTFLAPLLEVPVEVDTIKKFSAVLVIDLSQLEYLFEMVEKLMEPLRERLTMVGADMAKEKSELKGWAKKRFRKTFGDNHPDAAILKSSCLPVPFMILGTKYDVFQNFDSEPRKIACKCLRFIAHVYGGGLQFISHRDEAQLTKYRTMLGNFLFKSPPLKALQLDHNKPLSIPCGMDSLAQIGLPPDTVESKISKSHLMETWKGVLNNVFPQKAQKFEKGTNPAEDEHYKEAMIDSMRAQKNQELERYKHDAEKKAQGLAQKSAKLRKGSGKLGR